MKKIIISAAIILGLLGGFYLIFASKVEQLPGTQGKKQVVTTFNILQDITKNIVQDRMDVISLIPPLADPHIYQPGPKDVITIGKADVIIMNGFGLEGWIERLITASGFKGIPTICTENIQPGFATTPCRKCHECPCDEHGNPIKMLDPHAWNSLINVIHYVDTIAKSVAENDPENAKFYLENAQNYKTKLQELHEWALKKVTAVPQEKRQVITSHDAFGYMGRDYHITFSGVQGASTEQEATPARIATIIERVKTLKIKAIFLEPEEHSNQKLIMSIANTLKIKADTVLYADSLSREDGPAASFTEMFCHNINKLVEAMLKNGL